MAPTDFGFGRPAADTVDSIDTLVTVEAEEAAEAIETDEMVVAPVEVAVDEMPSAEHTIAAVEVEAKVEAEVEIEAEPELAQVAEITPSPTHDESHRPLTPFEQIFGATPRFTHSPGFSPYGEPEPEPIVEAHMAGRAVREPLWPTETRVVARP